MRPTLRTAAGRPGGGPQISNPDDTLDGDAWMDPRLAGPKELSAMMAKLANTVTLGGRALGCVGVVLGDLDMASGVANGTDSGAVIAATTSVIGAPLGIATGAVGLLRGAASMLSGDIPVAKRITDDRGWLGGLTGIK